MYVSHLDCRTNAMIASCSQSSPNVKSENTRRSRPPPRRRPRICRKTTRTRATTRTSKRQFYATLGGILFTGSRTRAEQLARLRLRPTEACHATVQTRAQNLTHLHQVSKTKTPSTKTVFFFADIPFELLRRGATGCASVGARTNPTIPAAQPMRSKWGPASAL